MPLRGCETIEAISSLIDILEIATEREALLAMTNEDGDTVSKAGIQVLK